MQYKNILVYLDQGVSNLERVNTAISFAKAHDARLTGVVVNAVPTASIIRKLGIGNDETLLEQGRAHARSII